MKLTKKVLSLLLSMLLVLTALPLTFAKTAAPADGDLLLATMSDVHYYPESLAQYRGEAFYDYTRGFNCVWDNLDGVVESAFAAIKRDVTEKGLKYLVLTGDLTTNGEYEGHAALAEKLRALKEETGLHIYVINGNHDVNNPDAAQFVTPDGLKTRAKMTTPKDFYDIYYDFGFSEAASTFSAPDTGKAGALSYSIDAGAFRFIMIDAGKYTADNTEKKQDVKETGGNITPEVLEWVKGEAAAAKEKGQTPIAFTHWNLSEMNYLHGEILQGFVIDDGYRLQETFADMGIHYVYSGHQHVSDIDVTYSDAGEKLVSVITPILTQYPYAFRESAFSVKDGKISARFDMLPVDDAMPVVSRAGETQASPYRVTGFNLQFGGDPATYFMYMIKGLLQDWVSEIRETGSIVTFIKNQFGFDIAAKISDLIRGGLVVGDNEIFTADNVMALIRDIDTQLVERYIYQPQNLWGPLEKTLRDLLATKVSDVPSTALLDSYGIGDAGRGGNLGDLFFSVMVYMYSGNEDMSEDAFMNDVYAHCGDPAFVDLIFGAVLDHVLDEFLMGEILSHVQVNLQALLNGKAPSVANFIAIFYRFFTAVSSEWKSDKNLLNKIFAIAEKLLNDPSATSYAYLADFILGTGRISYGSSVHEVAQNLLNQYFGEKEKKATAEQIRVVFDTILHDEDRDWDVSYDYAGPEAVTPTLEDFQIPNEQTVRVDGDALIFHWLTKYSVTGTDIEIKDASGKAVDPARVKTETIPDAFTSYGFSFGSFGILPYTRDINRHLVTVTGLTPGMTYTYRVGDAEKNFWSDEGSVTFPAETDFSFLFLDNVAPAVPADCEAFAERLKLAVKETAPAFLILSGDSVLSGKDDLQMNTLLGAAADTLKNIPIQYVTGDRDLGDAAFATRHFGIVSSDHYNEGLAGVNYSFNVGNTHFALLAGEDLDRDGRLSYTQQKWLKEDLAANGDATWTVLAVHSDVQNDAAYSGLKNALFLLMADYGVDVLLAGGTAYYRSHALESGYPSALTEMTEVTVGDKAYPAYEKQGIALAFTVGGFGDEFGDVTAEEGAYAKTAASNMPTFLSVTVTEKALAFDLYELAGDRLHSLDAFALTKEEYKRMLGDLDLDSAVTAADARLALRAAVGLDKIDALTEIVADVDFDRRVTAADARLILRAAVALEALSPTYITIYGSDLK